MKSGVRETIGKTIMEVLVGYNRRGGDPVNQVFLVFEDGTYFEFWGAQFNCAGGVDRGGAAAVIAYVERSCGSEVVSHYREARDSGADRD